MESQSRSLYHALAKALFLAAGLIVLLWLLYRIQTVLMASLLALILALALNAPVTWMEKRGISRGVGTGLSFLSVALVTAGIGWLVVPRLAEELPRLIQQIPEMVDSVAAQVAGIVGDQPEIYRQADRLVDWAFGLMQSIWGYADVMAGMLILGLFLVALVLYMVANLKDLLQWYVLSMPPRLRDSAARAFTRASDMVIGWVIASVILGGIKAVAAFTFLLIVGVPGALVWAVIAFFGAFIPRVGFYLMTIPPVLVAFTVDPLVALWTLIFYVAFSEFLGNFVAPKIFAEIMQLNAVLILFMTLAMGYAFGVLGVLIASPVAGFIKTYYDEFLLARRPPDPDIEARVVAMMERNTDGAGERAAPE
ncbi:N/A [soil metagenome]